MSVTVKQQADWLNEIIKFLAKRDLPELTKSRLHETFGLYEWDMIVLLGNSSLFVAETAAQAYKDGLTSKILICGGIGHSTSYLYESIRRSKVYQKMETENKPEAELFYEVLTEYQGIDKSALLLESRSTNCGSNAEETQKLLKDNNLHPGTVLLLQDPILQRRSEASFQKVFEGENIKFMSYASFIPFVKEQEGDLVYEEESNLEFCKMDRLISLVMGEVPRLLDDENGYGPKGKNYIVQVNIPEEVKIAFRQLQVTLGNNYSTRTKI